MASRDLTKEKGSTKSTETKEGGRQDGWDVHWIMVSRMSISWSLPPETMSLYGTWKGTLPVNLRSTQNREILQRLLCCWWCDQNTWQTQLLEDLFWFTYSEFRIWEWPYWLSLTRFWILLTIWTSKQPGLTSGSHQRSTAPQPNEIENLQNSKIINVSYLRLY